MYHRSAVFVDPYNRPGKYASNVMHTIQCGREFHAPFEGLWRATLCSCSFVAWITCMLLVSTPDLAGCYQMPTLVLSCSVNAGHLLYVVLFAGMAC